MRETSLGDYLRLLRRGKALIIITALACGAIALAASLLIRPTYQAQAAVAVQDPNMALALTGSSGAPTSETPLQLALSYAPQVTRQEVVARVATDLRGALSPGQLRKDVSVSVDPNSALLDITAAAGSATQAAAIANAYATEDVRLTGTEARHGYAQEAGQVATRLRRAANNPSLRSVYLSELFRFQTLSTVAAPLQVNSAARVPTSPTSPRPLRYTVAALVFGLLLGILLVYLRDRLDRRLLRAADVEEVLPHPIIGAIRPDALGHPVMAANGSPNSTSPISAADLEAFRILRQNFQFMAAEPLRSVLVTSAMAEEGKSTVAAGMAATLAAGGKRVLLVDCDLRRPAVASRFHLAEKPGLTDYLTGNATLDQVVQVIQAAATNGNGNGAADAPFGSHGLSCITAGTLAPRPAELLASDRFQRFLAELGQAYDTVLLDSAPLLTVADSLAIVPVVSSVLICVRLQKTTRDHARAVQHALGRLPERPIALVLTGVRSEGDGYYYGYEGYEGVAAPAGR